MAAAQCLTPFFRFYYSFQIRVFLKNHTEEKKGEMTNHQFSYGQQMNNFPIVYANEAALIHRLPYMNVENYQ